MGWKNWWNGLGRRYGGEAVPANAMRWSDGTVMYWPDGTTMLWPS